MTNSLKTITGILILAGMLGLTDCSSGSNHEATASPAASQPGASSSGSNDAATVSPAASQPEASSSSAPSAAPAEASATASPSAAAGGGASSTAAPQDSSKLLEELLQLAREGKVPGVEYAAHTGLIDDVEAAWGEPDTKETAGKGIYATYSKQHVVIGFNKGSRIFDVRSSAADLQKLTLKEIEAVLGEPERTAVNGGDKIYMYQAGKQYELKFIIPEASGTVDHISVFSEQDSINNMAG
ncbi:YjgB family protein [Paenibacillus sonchi]|uniref:YjgB family protein n=2 Tax=Paenibacillus sonchi TaxID=373687 RepID=A0A974PH17_9BACL|nr:YjgB family protein [Paenibacillus sonchi]QQZ63620.1 YjgB family protein [Paenibacillus sonchi]